MSATNTQGKGIRALIPTTDQLLTQGDLINFKNEILLEFKRILKESNGEPGKRWLKSTEVKKILGISHGFLQTLRDNGTLPFTKIGGSIYYDYEDICKMMAVHKIRSNEGFNISN